MTTHRKCGDCQLCCWIMPTEEIAKVANTRCQYQRVGKGCSIYSRRPMSCQLWSCRWLLDDDMADQPRPDRSHIVLDMMPDVIRMTDERDGTAETLPVIVAWVHPDHRDAWKSEAFARYVMRQKVPVLIRYSSHEGGGVLFPPAITGGDKIVWHSSSLGSDMPTTLREKAAAIGATMSESPLPGDLGAVTLTMADGTTKTVAAQTKLDVMRVPMEPARR